MIHTILNTITKLHHPNLFNPYTDCCPAHDKPGAASIRQRNLRNYLAWQHQRQPVEWWVAESGAYKGLRRTGVPLLPEDEMAEFNEKADSEYQLQQATHAAAEHSYTNKIVWEEAKKRDPIPIFWNAVMGHPHREGQPLSNRTPTRQEIEAYATLIPLLSNLFNIRHIVCIGRKAEAVADQLNMQYRYVRHPANGGVKKFRKQIHIRG